MCKVYRFTELLLCIAHKRTPPHTKGPGTIHTACTAQTVNLGWLYSTMQCGWRKRKKKNTKWDKDIIFHYYTHIPTSLSLVWNSPQAQSSTFQTNVFDLVYLEMITSGAFWTKEKCPWKRTTVNCYYRCSNGFIDLQSSVQQRFDCGQTCN